MMNLIKEPLTLEMDAYSEKRIVIHRKILSRKEMIREVFDEFHVKMLSLSKLYLNQDSLKIELGAGVHPLKVADNTIISTDILYAPHLDRTLDAQKMDLGDRTVSVLFAQNCFHHFPEPDLFFKEALRVLVPGGGIVIIEPHYGFLAGLIYKKLFSIEGYDKKSLNWGFLEAGEEPIPNQALSYVCFVRDKKTFLSRYPEFEIVAIEASSNWLRYLFSGGLNFKQLVPNFSLPLIKFIERCLSPMKRFLGLHTYYIVRKKNS